MTFTMEINGREIVLQRTGPQDGPVLVLLHHGLGAIRSWKGQILDFCRAGYQVIAYDRWGHGASAARDRWSMPNFEPDLADLQEILRQLECDQVCMVGHSDGGNIAMLYAQEYPHQVACLVLIAAHVYIEPKMAAGIQALRNAFENDARFRKQLRRVHGEKSEALFWGWYRGWSRPELQDWDMRLLLSGISCPALVVQGSEDEHATPQHARDLASSLPAAELCFIPGAGHMLPQENPREFNQSVLKFLKHKISLPIQG
jgi:pimeloyl-ACP methyl ester carboxylesterase